MLNMFFKSRSNPKKVYLVKFTKDYFINTLRRNYDALYRELRDRGYSNLVVASDPMMDCLHFRNQLYLYKQYGCSITEIELY